MKSVGAFDAKTNLSKLLERVARGESFLITKRGKPVASLSPVTTGGKHGFRALIEGFREEYGTATNKITSEEIAEFKETGRR